MDETLGTVLRRLRHERGLTLEEVSKATGISVAMLSRAEREQRVPSTEAVAVLSAYYGVPVEVLERYAAELHYRSRSNPRQGSRPPESTLASPAYRWTEPRSGEPAWFDAEHAPAGRTRATRSFQAADVACTHAFDAFLDVVPESDALRDAGRVAEIALQAAMRAVARAKASGDPAEIAEAERVISRLRRIVGADPKR